MIATAPVRVFVVDDDRDTTECMRLLIGHWGHDVHVANDGRAAIQEASRLKPDVMVIDLGMPVVDGLAVARSVRQLPDLASMSLVALTGYGDERHRQEALAAGFDEFMIKPLPMESLVALLQRVADRVASSRQLVDQAREAAAKSMELKARHSVQSAELAAELAAEPPAEPVQVRIEKSGISDLVFVSDRPAAEHLRRWLREQACRVGPVFEPQPGKVAFYTYSRRQTRSLLGNHPKFRIES